jgi:hypothetical protein
MVVPLCGPARATVTKGGVEVDSTTGTSVGAKDVAVTTTTIGVGEAQADRINVNIKVNTIITLRTFFIKSPFLLSNYPGK